MSETRKLLPHDFVKIGAKQAARLLKRFQRAGQGVIIIRDPETSLVSRMYVSNRGPMTREMLKTFRIDRLTLGFTVYRLKEAWNG